MFSEPERINVEKENNKNKCEVCGKSSEKNICIECQKTILKVSKTEANQRRPKLSKVVKKKFWKIKGNEKKCENCGLELKTGGSKIAIHPFRKADWNGTVEDLKALCPLCLGKEAQKRDKIFKLAKALNNNNKFLKMK